MINRYEHLFARTGVTVTPGLQIGKRLEEKSRSLNLVMANLTDKLVTLPKITIVTLTAVTDSADICESKSQVQTQDHRMEQMKNTNLSQERNKKNISSSQMMGISTLPNSKRSLKC